MNENQLQVAALSNVQTDTNIKPPELVPYNYVNIAESLAKVTALLAQQNGKQDDSNKSNDNKRGGGGHADGRGRGARREKFELPWRKLDKYCFSKGVNARCNGTKCNQYCKKQSDHNPSATFENRGNGSIKNVECWGGWLDPTGQYFATKPE